MVRQNFFKMNDYKDLSKKIRYVFNNRNKFKKKISIGFKNLDRFDEMKNLNLYYKIVKKYL